MNTIDARSFEPRSLAHGAILGALSKLPEGVALTVIAPREPLPLYDEVEAQYPNIFDHKLVSQEANEFHIVFTKK